MPDADEVAGLRSRVAQLEEQLVAARQQVWCILWLVFVVIADC